MDRFSIHYCDNEKVVNIEFGNGLYTSAYTVGFNGGTLDVRYSGCLSGITADTALTYTIDSVNQVITFTVPANTSYDDITYNFRAVFCDDTYADAIIEQSAYVAIDYLRFKPVSGDCYFMIDFGSGSEKSVQYSLDGGGTWSTLSNHRWSSIVPVGKTILWKGNNTASQYYGVGIFSSSGGTFEALGNPMSLASGDSFDEATTLADYQFYKLFSACTKLVKADEINLPITTLANHCYDSMFYSCKITTAPELPATTLASNCYASMFAYCASLTTAPELPATTLAEQCYMGMFGQCTGLTTAPDLPATTMTVGCYASMFAGCGSLTPAPVLPATTLAAYCYSGMFAGCGSLTTAPALPVTTLAAGCYGSMFDMCTGLTTAPDLPATTLSNECYRNMFAGCKSLTTPPVMSATTLADYCCYRMFYNCSSLTTAPVLYAETLVLNCYNQMFSNCSSLNSVTCLLTGGSSGANTDHWLYLVAAGGTFTKKRGAFYYRTVDGIPNGWTVIEVD